MALAAAELQALVPEDLFGPTFDRLEDRDDRSPACPARRALQRAGRSTGTHAIRRAARAGHEAAEAALALTDARALGA